MLAHEYARLADFENWYWWYIARREELLDVIRQLPLGRTARIFDAGCGSGRNLVEVCRTLECKGFGVDVAMESAKLWKGDVGDMRSCCLGSINELPYSNESFDVAFSADVVGCDGVEISNALRELLRTTRKGGSLVLFAPAYQWMRSRHDVAVHSVRRFARNELAALVAKAGFEVESAVYRLTLLFPLIAGVRLLTKPFVKSGRVRSDMTRLPPWINQVLLRLARWDRQLCECLGAPFGSSILVIARKPA